MKSLLIVSLAANVLLLSGILWLRSDCKTMLHERAVSMMQADEMYIDMLDRTVKAIDAPGLESSKTTILAVRKVVKVGHENMELRRKANVDL